MVLFGMGMGAVGAVQAHPDFQIQRQDQNVGLVIFEDDPLALLASCHMLDLSGLFESQRVFWILGDDHLNGWEELCKTEPLTWARSIGFSYGRPVATQQEHDKRMHTAEAVKQDLQDGATELHQDINRLTSRCHEQPYDRLTNVFVTLSRDDRAVTFIALGLLQAMEEAGYSTKVAWVGKDVYTPLQPGLTYVARDCPDLVLVMNNLPAEMLTPQIDLLYQRPRLVWFVDNPRSYLHVGKTSQLGPHDYVALWDAHHEAALKERGAEWIGIMPYAADRQAPAEPEDHFRCPISFVGQVYNRAKSRGFFDDMAWSYIQALAQASVCDPLASYESLVERVPPPAQLDLLGLEKRFNIPYIIYSEGNALKRLEHLRPLAKLGLHLYGPDTWLQFFDERDPLQECWKGPINHHMEFPALIRSCQINLNIHSLQAITSLNMRDYDVPLQGGFLLTDWVEGADLSFIPDREMVFYRGAQDLLEKAAHYLEHAEQRMEIAQRGTCAGSCGPYVYCQVE